MSILGVSCPDCHARKGMDCVYLWPKDEYGQPRERTIWLSPSTLALMDRAGTPTQRPHTGRFTKAHLAEQVDRRKAREAEHAARTAPSRAREEILRANADAVADEQHALVAWLRENADVLIGNTPAARSAAPGLG